MSIPKTPSQKSQYGKLNKRLAQYVSLVQLLYEKYNKKASQIAISDGYTGDGEYHFDSVRSKKLISDVQADFVAELRSLIYSGITKEWTNSNHIQDLLADKVLDFYEVTNKKGERYKKYYQTNGDSLKAFQQRRDNGLNLSQKLWKQAEEYKTALEEAISTAIQRGNSAVALSKRVSQYLLDFDKMRSDYTDKFGKKSKALDCEYKSIRLARSEINMAYRTAEQERWLQMDFVLGYEIKLSKSHKVKDVCDCLAGKYPKEFRWTGWHPNDMCYAIPILMTDEQFWGFDEDGNDVEDTPRYVHDVPAGFKHWVEDNKSRIKIADSRGTLPYFLRDNKLFYAPIRRSRITRTKYILQRGDIYTNNGTITLDYIQRIGADRDARITSEGVFSTNLVYNPQRARLHNEIIESYLERGSNYGSDTVYMLGGGPANGKSTLVQSGKLPHPEGGLVIDADEVKAMIPEYKKMIDSGRADMIAAAANFVHEESSMLGKRIQEKALERDMAVIIDGVNDGAYSKVESKVNAIKEKYGKRVRADYVSLDMDKSLRYAKARAEKTGRKVPTEFIVEANAGVSKLIPEAIENALFDELYLWDTNENGNPRLILSQIDGVLKIFDKKLYQNFLNKAQTK